MVRIRAGIAAVVTGVLGLAVAWWMVDGAGLSGVIGTISTVVLALGLLSVARAGGEAATRITGGLLCIAGLAVAVTQHQLWWWLRAGWETPMTIASLLIALAGLGVLLFAYGFRMAGLSGACGVLAAACLAAVLLPYLGSEDKAVLRALAAALGAVALVAGFRAAAKPPLAGSPAARGALIVASGVAVAFAGYDAYGTYAPTGYRVATVTATVLGIVGVLVVGGIGLHGPVGGAAPGSPAVPTPDHAVPREATPTPHPAEPRSPAPVEPAGSPGRPEAQSGPAAVVDSTPPAQVGKTAAGGPSLRARLETISLAVGVVIGLITILKEVVAALRALFG